MSKEKDNKKNLEETPVDAPEEQAAENVEEELEEEVADNVKEDPENEEKESFKEHDDNHIKAPGEDYEDTGQDNETAPTETEQTPLAERFGTIDLLARKIGVAYIALAIIVIAILIFVFKNMFSESGVASYKPSHSVSKSKTMPPVIPSGHINNHSDTKHSNAKPVGTSSDVQQQIATVPTKPAMTAEHTKKIVKEFILNNPEVIMESLTKLEKKEAMEKETKTKEDLNKNGATIQEVKPFIGNKNGTINIVEFFDYRCIHCSKVYPTLMKLISNYPNLKISLVPLPFMGPASKKAAKYSIAVSILYPNKFASFHSDLLTAQTIDDQSVAKLLAKHGLDKDKVMQVFNSSKTEAILNENLQHAQESGVRGVPSFVIAGEFVPGAASYDDFKRRIDAIKPAK